MNKPLKIASWNVNSLPVRTPQIIEWMNQQSVDLLAIQETKVPDDRFPCEDYTAQGFHIAYTGQKTYNGVALISRLPLSDIYIEPDTTLERRIIAASIGNIRIINLYVPNGSDLSSDKYVYKLNWLRETTAFIQHQQQLFPNLAVMGDFNIAPEDIDVHDPKEWANTILTSESERSAFLDLKKTGLNDSFRTLHPQSQAYSWWDYRAANFRRNRGLRIDLILLSDTLMTRCSSAGIDTLPRKNERPSDHTPVWIMID